MVFHRSNRNPKTGAHYVAHYVLKYTILLPLPSKCGDYRYTELGQQQQIFFSFRLYNLMYYKITLCVIIILLSSLLNFQLFPSPYPVS